MLILVSKLFLITIFMFFSSKSLGILITKRMNFKFKDFFSIGYFANIAIFFILLLPAMIFKLSSSYMLISGLIYLFICFFSIFKALYKKELLKFENTELFAIGIAIIFLILYVIYIDFGNIEMYDTYFYSVLSNGSKSIENLSKYDPYTGLSNVQNFYKYISYYYMPSFFSVITKIKYPYLILIWSFSFMNFLLLSSTAFGIVRVSDYKYVNNIISIFILTFILSIFRAPFNILYSLLIVVPIYLMFILFNNLENLNKKNLLFLLVISISTLAMSSSSLFLGFSMLYVAFVTMCIMSKNNEFKNLFLLSIPFVLLLLLYIYESLDNVFILLYSTIIFIGIYILLYNKKVKKIINIIGRIMFFVVPVFLLVVPKLDIQNILNKTFYQKNTISSNEVIDNNDNKETCLVDKSLNIKNNINKKFDVNKHSTSMEYILNNKSSLLSNTLILLTHSLIKYGGLLSLLYFGIFKKENKILFISFVVYLFTFFNPLTINGINLIIDGLADRITLFFNTFYSVYGVKILFDYLENNKINKKTIIIFQKIKNYISYLYLLFFILSFLAFISLLNKKTFKDYDVLYKIPKSQIDVSEYLNKEINKYTTDKKPRVFYTASAFNITLVDEKPFNKVKIINSKEYMNFFNNSDEVTDKIILYNYFENEIYTNQTNIEKKCEEKLYLLCNCDINNLIDIYEVDYIVSLKLEETTINNIKVNNTIIYQNNNYQILKVSEINE